MSYSSCANHGENMGAKATRAVSCNTTGLARSLVPIIESVGHIDVEVTLIRRAADPGDSTRGPINAIAPVLKVPSHHGPDLITVTEGVSITSLAVAVPTTIMHVHAVSVRLPEDHGLDTRAVLDLWSTSPRLLMMDGAMDGIRTTAEVMEMARDLGRTWGDRHEIFIWKDGVRLEGRRLHYFQCHSSGIGCRSGERRCRSSAHGHGIGTGEHPWHVRIGTSPPRSVNRCTGTW